MSTPTNTVGAYAEYFLLGPDGYITPSHSYGVRQAVADMQTQKAIAVLDRRDLEEMRKRCDYLLGYVIPSKEGAA